MDLDGLLSDLRAESERILRAITVIERLVGASRPRAEESGNSASFRKNRKVPGYPAVRTNGLQIVPRRAPAQVLPLQDEKNREASVSDPAG